MTKPPVPPAQRVRPSDKSIAQLVAEARLIISEINLVSDELAVALRERLDDRA